MISSTYTKFVRLEWVGMDGVQCHLTVIFFRCGQSENINISWEKGIMTNINPSITWNKVITMTKLVSIRSLLSRDSRPSSQYIFSLDISLMALDMILPAHFWTSSTFSFFNIWNIAQENITIFQVGMSLTSEFLIDISE